VKIVDFGIAKFLSSTESQHLTQTGELFGSPFYMSPEQTVAKAADQRSDIYAVGCIMYEALSGDVPISGNTAFETLMKHVSEKPIPIQERKLRENISDGLQKLIMKALEKEPGKRHQSMTALREALESVPEAIGKKPSPFSLNSTSFGITPRTKKVIVASTVTLLLAGVSVSQLLQSGSVSEFFKTAVTNLSTNYSGGKLSVGQGSSSSEIAVKPMPIERPQVSWRSLDNKELNSQISNNLKITDLCLKDCAIDDTGASYLQALNLTHLEVLRCPNIKTDGYRSIIRAQPHLQSLIISNEDTSSNDETVANPETSTSDDIIPELKKLKELKSLSLMNFADLRGANLHLLPKSLTNLSLAGNKRIPTNKLAELATYTSLKKLDLSKTLVSDATLAKLTNITGLQVLKLNDCPIGDDSMDAISRFKNLQKLSIRKTLVSRDGFYKLATLPSLREIDVTDVDAIKATDAIKLERLFKQRFCLIIPYISRSEPLREGELDKLVAPDTSN
jgi:serine/threonine protein kinase